MKYIIEKGSSKMLMFMLTGIFLVLLFSFSLYDYLQMNQFIYEFPGDWDKPLGIAVGLFLIIRSIKFIPGSRDLFIKISKNQLVYRTSRSDAVHKIAISDIEKIEEKKKKMILVSKDLAVRIIVDFNGLRDSKRDPIQKALIELNSKL